MTARIGILVYDGFDIIDAGGPYEVFLTASRLAERDGDAPAFSVELVSPGGHDVVAYGGMTLTALGNADESRDYDAVVIPGTIALEGALGEEPVGASVRTLVDAAKLATSVCTGSFLLAQQGLIDDLPATTHWEDVEALREAGVPGATGGVRWVDAGQIITSGGLTSGMHMALHVVSLMLGEPMARRTARQLDMDWSPDPTR
ncbi:DJ-1/PfpI family protein [Demequina sp. SO4-13]|uniref:DJ-1/PfpI family protein n=1 Tax=Demequina sp. SO4-13 TaxID=3401027 RepID=UPI003AF85E17